MPFSRVSGSISDPENKDVIARVSAYNLGRCFHHIRRFNVNLIAYKDT